MSGRRARMIFKLVYNKDPNMLETVKRECFSKRADADKVLKKLEGTQVYKLAKRLYRRFGKQDNWGGIRNAAS